MAPFPDEGPGHKALGSSGTQSEAAFLALHPHLPPCCAASRRDCLERFGVPRLERITQDDDVICSTEYSRIVPLENGEVGQGPRRPRGVAAASGAGLTPSCLQVVVSLVNGRPGAMNFSYSPLLRDFTKATNIRLRFLRTNTLLGHLMGKALRDPTVTRRVSTPARRPRGGSGSHGGSERMGAVLVGGPGWCGGHDTHSQVCSTITASRTSALAGAASATATRMCVTPQTPQIPLGEIFGSLPIPCIPRQPGGGGAGSTARHVPGPCELRWPPRRGVFPMCTARRGAVPGPCCQ